MLHAIRSNGGAGSAKYKAILEQKAAHTREIRCWHRLEEKLRQDALEGLIMLLRFDDTRGVGFPAFTRRPPKRGQFPPRVLIIILAVSDEAPSGPVHSRVSGITWPPKKVVLLLAETAVCKGSKQIVYDAVSRDPCTQGRP
jgi:hypothetical protein